MSLVLIVGGKTNGVIAASSEILQVFPFDAVTEFTANYRSRVTSHPIEDGSSVSDHVTNENVVIDITGVISSYPALETRLDYDTSTVQDVIKTLEQSGRRGSVPRLKAAAEALEKARDSRTLITVTSELRAFDNCIITSISFPRSANIGDSLVVTMTLEQLNIVQPIRAEVSVSLLDTAVRNKKKSGNAEDPSEGSDADKAKELRLVRTAKRAFSRNNRNNNTSEE